MDKYTIIVSFYDKYTGVYYQHGTVHEFSEKRAQEILTVGNFIKKIEEKPEPEEKAEKTGKSAKKSNKKPKK